MPARIGRYDVVCKLGVGGMADVYLAHQPGPFSAGKLVVIKQLRLAMADDEQLLHMFADESRIAVRLNHPNVVHTYEVVAEPDEYYLTLEFLDGKSLHQILQRVTRAQMPLELHIWVLTQVLTGLHYAHELAGFDGAPLGIVHRDVSPSNVIVTYDGGVKLLDFGIAKCLGAISATRAGLIKGKLGYAAPEQCLCKATDRRTDIFAVGIMLWEAIAWRKRAIGETDASVYHARVLGSELGLEQVCPTAPPELVSICNKAVAVDPDQRFQTALEFRQALEGYLRNAGRDAGVGSERLNAFMREHFSRDMEEMRQRIDGHLGPSQSPASGRVPVAFGAGVTSPGRRMQESSSLSMGGRLSGMPNAAMLNAAMQNDSNWMFRPWYQRPYAWALGGGAVVGASILGGWLLRSPMPAAPAAVTLAQPVLPAPPANARPAPVSAPQAEPSQPVGQVTVSIAIQPSKAALRLDGQRISNPYRAAHGRDTALHHLTVALPGFQTVEQDLRFDHDVEIELSLSAQTGARRDDSDPPRAARKSSARDSAEPPEPPRAAQQANESSALEPSESQEPAGIVQPGEDLGRPRSRGKSRTIDEMDPYSP